MTIAVTAELMLMAGFVAAEFDDAPGLLPVSFVVALPAQAVRRGHQARELGAELDGVI